jgi:hypothetical protein
MSLGPVLSNNINPVAGLTVNLEAVFPLVVWGQPLGVEWNP